MAIPQTQIKNAIKAAIEAAYEYTDPDDREQVIDKWAGDIAAAISQAIGGTDVVFELQTEQGPVTGTITLKPPQ